jgi:virginiamycin B lyase
MVDAHAPTTTLPWGIALDPSRGYVWVAEPGCDPLPACATSFPSSIGQYAYSDGAFIKDFTEPAGYTGPLFVVNDAAGHLWFTQPNSDAIGELDTVNNVWQQWHVKKNAHPYDLAIDSRGNLWFTEWGVNQIGFFDTHTHTLVETPIPTANTNPYGITIDNKGTVWFAENSPIGQIGSFTATANGKITIVEHAVTALRPHLITTDKAGNVWFTEGFAGYISEYNPVTGTDLRYRVYSGVCLSPINCAGTHISGIRVADNGDVWFSDSLNERVGYLVPATGQVVARVLPINSHPHDGLVLDNNGRVWFTEEYGMQLNTWPMGNVK